MNTGEKKEKYNEAEWELITKFITGRCSNDEKSLFHKWIDQDPVRKKEIELLQKSYLPRRAQVSEVQTQNAWNEILTAMNSGKKQAVKSKSNPLFYRNSYAILKIAAVLFIMFGTYFIGKKLNILGTHSVPSIVMNEKVTSFGEKAIITLNDGSIITLNADSKLSYPNNFNASTREISLQGEAFFDVAHDSSKPFIVNTGNISTTVLGTKFNISAFPKESRIAVSLVEGKIKVSNEKSGLSEEAIVLKPMQQLNYDIETNINTVDLFDLQVNVGWKDNILKFKSESLENVLVKLERAFGIRFELKEKSFGKFKITGNFQRESYYTISESLKKLTGLQYKTIKEDNAIKKIVFFKK